MNEIKLTLEDPNLAASQLRHAANHWNDGPPKSNPVGDLLLSLADSIEEQVKPAIEEPTEWGSIVRARRVGYGAEDTTTLRWQRQNTHDSNDSWTSEPAGDLGVRYSSHWSYLRNVKVLRVGVGPQPLAEWESDLLNEQHRRDTAAAVLGAMDVDRYLIDAVVNARPR